MSGTLLLGMLCIAVIVLAALVALVVVLMKPQKNQPKTSTDIATRKDGKAWILFVGIALVLVIWSFWISLFFLAVAGIMRLDPKPHQKEIPYPSDLAKEEAKGLYTWLLLSPFLTVPTMLVAALFLDNDSSSNQRVFAALIPLVFHLPMLLKLSTKSAFVYRHTQQAVFLVALRAGMASIALSIGWSPWEGLWLFFIGNGALWLFGSLWGRDQANRKDCWWMRRKGEIIQPKIITPIPATNNDLKDLLKSPNAEVKTARQKALHAFRTGTPAERKQAVLALSQLGEVEKF